MDNHDKDRVRAYAARTTGGHSAWIHRDGTVTVSVQGNGSNVINGSDRTGGRILVGYADEILREIEALDEYRRLDALDRERR